MIITRSNVSNNRTQRIERCLVTLLNLAIHVLANLVHGHVAGTFDKRLHILSPGTLHKFAHRIEFGKLSAVVGIVDGTRTEAIAQRKGYVVLCTDVADVIKVLIEETFLLMHLAPLRNDTSSTTHHAAKTFVGIMDVLQADATMDGKIVYALLALFNERIAEKFPRQIFCFTFYFLHCLIHRHSTHRNRAVTDNPFARFMDVLSCRKIHQRVPSPLATPDSLFHFFFNSRSGSRVTNIGIDLHQEACTNNHRLGLRMIDIGRQDSTSGCNLLTHKLGSNI